MSVFGDAIDRERFLFPPLFRDDIYPGEQIEDPAFQVGINGWVAAAGTSGTPPLLSWRTDLGYLSDTALQMNKQASGVSDDFRSWAAYQLTPPRPLLYPATPRTIGPVTVTTAPFNTLTDNQLEVQDASIFPESGSALLPSGSVTGGSEIVWDGKSGNTLTGVIVYPRGEGYDSGTGDYRDQTFSAGTDVIGTIIVSRVLASVKVSPNTSSQDVRLEIHTLYNGAPTGFSITGPYHRLPGGTVPQTWSTIEVSGDLILKNTNDPANPANGLELRVTQKGSVSVGHSVYIDFVGLYHELILSENPIQRIPSPVTSQGVAWERTVGKEMRSARVSPDSGRDVLTWDSQSPLADGTRRNLEVWHRDLCYPEDTIRTFHHQPLRVGKKDYRPLGAEVLWADAAPVFTPMPLGQNWGLTIPMEQIPFPPLGISLQISQETRTLGIG